MIYMPKISVIVPVYNSSRYLINCVESILSQSFTDFELLLIDDASTDNSYDICNDYKNKDSRVRIFRLKNNSGAAVVRNIGIQNSRSNYISFVDSDDWISINYLDYLHRALMDTNLDVSCGLFDFTNRTGSSLQSSPYKCEIIDTSAFFQMGDLLGNSACCKLYKKSLFKDISYPSGRLYEDTGTTYKLLFKNKNIAFVDCKLYMYFGHYNSANHSSFNEKKLSCLDSCKEKIAFFVNYGNKNLINYSIHIYLKSIAAFINLTYKDNQHNKTYKMLKMLLKQELRNYRNNLMYSKYYYYLETVDSSNKDLLCLIKYYFYRIAFLINQSTKKQ